MSTRPNARKLRRAELESTWSVWDAKRPLRRSDLDAVPPPGSSAEVSAPADWTTERAEAHGGTTSDVLRLRLADGSEADVRIDGASVARFTSATDAQLAALFGVSEMDVRESRKWAREQAARGLVMPDGSDDGSRQ